MNCYLVKIADTTLGSVRLLNSKQHSYSYHFIISSYLDLTYKHPLRSPLNFPLKTIVGKRALDTTIITKVIQLVMILIIFDTN